MRRNEFRAYLEDVEKISSKQKAVSSRLSRADDAEQILGESLDIVVIDDDRMYDALVRIKKHPQERNGNIQNALRWYYQFVNGKEFPRLNSYHRT